MHFGRIGSNESCAAESSSMQLLNCFYPRAISAVQFLLEVRLYQQGCSLHQRSANTSAGAKPAIQGGGSVPDTATTTTGSLASMALLVRDHSSSCPSCLESSRHFVNPHKSGFRKFKKKAKIKPPNLGTASTKLALAAATKRKGKGQVLTCHKSPDEYRHRD